MKGELYAGDACTMCMYVSRKILKMTLYVHCMHAVKMQYIHNIMHEHVTLTCITSCIAYTFVLCCAFEGKLGGCAQCVTKQHWWMTCSLMGEYIHVHVHSPYLVQVNTLFAQYTCNPWFIYYMYRISSIRSRPRVSAALVE